MKKFVLLFAVAIIGYGLQAQNCQADFTYTVDSNSYTITFADQSIIGDSSDYITSWSWDFHDGSSSTQQNVTHTYNSPGPYLICLTISTNLGCTSTFCDSVVLINDTCAGFIVDYTSSQESTPGANDGYIVLYITGGTPPYMINWSNGSTDSILTNLSAGTYDVTVVDDNSCTITQDIYIPEDSANIPCLGFYVSAALTPESAPAANDGALDVTVYNGTPPYNYNWSTGATTEDINNLPTGTYCLTVTDSACSTTGCFTVWTDTSAVVDTLSTAVIDSCINFTVTTYYIANYIWIDSTHIEITWVFSDSIQTVILTATYEVYQPGNYLVTVGINCGSKALTMYNDELYIGTYTSVNSMKATNNKLLLYPNPANDYLNVSFDSGNNNSTIKIYNATGQTVKLFNLNNSGEMKLDVSGLQKGIYIIRVENGSSILTGRFAK